MAKRNEEEFAVGDDAFMDTIANLVGIMIILVVIVGSKGFDAARTLAREEVQDQMEQLSTPTAKAENLDRDVDEQIDQLQQYEVETAYRNAERMTLVDQKTLIDQEIQRDLNNSMLRPSVPSRSTHRSVRWNASSKSLPSNRENCRRCKSRSSLCSICRRRWPRQYSVKSYM